MEQSGKKGEVEGPFARGDIVCVCGSSDAVTAYCGSGGQLVSDNGFANNVCGGNVEWDAVDQPLQVQT